MLVTSNSLSYVNNYKEERLMAASLYLIMLLSGSSAALMLLRFNMYFKFDYISGISFVFLFNVNSFG